MYKIVFIDFFNVSRVHRLIASCRFAETAPAQYEESETTTAKKVEQAPAQEIAHEHVDSNNGEPLDEWMHSVIAEHESSTQSKISPSNAPRATNVDISANVLPENAASSRNSESHHDGTSSPSHRATASGGTNKRKTYEKTHTDASRASSSSSSSSISTGSAHHARARSGSSEIPACVTQLYQLIQVRGADFLRILNVSRTTTLSLSLRGLVVIDFIC